MTYLYIFEQETLCKFLNNEIVIDYFPVKKKKSVRSKGEKIAIYATIGNESGIIGFADILGDCITAKKIIKEKAVNLLKKDYFQLPVKTPYLYSDEIIIPDKYLQFFPSFNTGFSVKKAYNTFVLYDFGIIYDEYEYIKRTLLEFNVSFLLSKNEENNWRYFIHKLREEKIYFRKNKKRIIGSCSKCGLKSETPFFLELHDTFDINFNQKYESFHIDKCILLCPTCHKQIHFEMIDKQW